MLGEGEKPLHGHGSQRFGYFARRIPRRGRLIIVVAIGLLMTIYLTVSVDRIEGLKSLAASQTKPSGPGLKVALVNTPRYHFEVVSPLLFALASQGALIERLDLFFTEYGSTRLGVRPLLDHMLRGDQGGHPWDNIWGKKEAAETHVNVQDPRELSKLDFVPDLMVLTSCSRDFEWTSIKDKRIYDPDWTNAPKELLCLVHEAEEWEKRGTNWRRFLKPWLDRGRVTFMTLSPHVEDYVRQNIENKWQLTKIIKDPQVVGHPGVYMMKPFIPVFEDPELFREEVYSNITGPFAAIPGKYEPNRRNYPSIFQHMTKNIELIQSINATLRLTGYGDVPPTIPEALQEHVIMHSHYNFPEYFSLLSRAMAMIPAFAHHKYFEDRASSTVATAVIAGVPLVGKKELVDKYAYLDMDCIWLQENDEEEVTTWLRVLKLGKEEWLAKKRKIRALRGRLIKENIRRFSTLLEDVRWRIGARGA